MEVALPCAVYIVHESPVVRHFLALALAAHGHECRCHASLDDFLATLPPLAVGCLVCPAECLDPRREWLGHGLRSRGARLAWFALCDDVPAARPVRTPFPHGAVIREEVVSRARVIEAVDDTMAWLKSGHAARRTDSGIH
jgi:FixJ family two-component response regulator